MIETEKTFFLDEVISIEQVGIVDTYDFTIPDTHCFFANDILVHNSIEEDADAVIFIHRPEEYESDQAAKAILHGKAVLILALNRSGPTYRDDRIKFSHETTSFHQESF